MNPTNNQRSFRTGLRLVQLLAGILLVALSSQTYAAVEKKVFYHNNLLGSPVAATDENGNLCWREDYRPYGEKIRNEDQRCGLDGNEVGFTGHVHDRDIGLTYMQARYYDPVVGRFMGVDPMGFKDDNPMLFNRYAYANNNPYLFIDPDGLEPGSADTYGPAWGGNASSNDPHNMHVFQTDHGEWVGLTYGEVHDDSIDPLTRDLVETLSPDPFSKSKKLAEAISVLAAIVKSKKITSRETTVIGRVQDLQNLKQGENSLLGRLPDRGSPKANWKQNSGVLRQEMGKGQPIRDASPGDTAGQFLNAERNLLRDRGWTFNPSTNYWTSPKK